MKNNLCKDELIEKMEELKEAIGSDELLLNLALALTSDELYENLEYIDRMFDTNVFE